MSRSCWGATALRTADGIFGNLAVSLFGDADVQTYGYGNTAVNVLGNTGTVFAAGVFNNATNLFGSNIFVETTGSNPVATWAFNVFGSSNNVVVGPGPLAIAGSILQTGATVTKVGPGFNINGIVVGGAAAIRSARTSAPTATAAHTGNKTSAPTATALRPGNKTPASAAAAHTRTQKPAPAATATSRGKK